MTNPKPIERLLLDMVDPLTAIRNAARTAEEHLTDGAPTAELSKDISLIRQAAAQLNRLLKEARAI
jgi:hypothetical protein